METIKQSEVSSLNTYMRNREINKHTELHKNRANSFQGITRKLSTNQSPASSLNMRRIFCAIILTAVSFR
jgi:hypothetical protein